MNALLTLIRVLAAVASANPAPREEGMDGRVRHPAEGMERIVLDRDGDGFAYASSGTPFRPWGFNYDHDSAGRLIEDYWYDEWDTITEDFREMKDLGANVVRVHLQLGKFMLSAEQPDANALDRLGKLLHLAETTGLYLNITGLGNYHKQDTPPWYQRLDEQGRWAVQANFWTAVAAVCAESPAVFCYDLVNEPLWPSAKKESEWLAGELGGKFFCQRITLDLDGRDAKQVARQWVDLLVAAIRSADRRHLVTLGVIPWALTFPNAKPTFYSAEVGENLDFVSVHFYPEEGKVPEAITALKIYDIGKPLVIEELFPLRCSIEELDAFITASKDIADGWIGFYWGVKPEDYAKDEPAGYITRSWLEYFRDKTHEMLP